MKVLNSGQDIVSVYCDPNMKADRWQIVCSGAVGGGPAFTVGGWYFQLRNREINARADYIFGGVGVGIGAKAAGGTGQIDFHVDDADFCSLDTVGKMSFNDLDGAGGWINSAGLAAGIGAGLMFVSAGGNNGTYFGMCPIYGASSGLEASVNFITFGKWLRVSEFKRFEIKVLKPPTPLKFRVAKLDIEVGPRAQVHYNYRSPVPRAGESIMTPIR